MATRRRDTVPGKEKRAVPPSPSCPPKTNAPIARNYLSVPGKEKRVIPSSPNCHPKTNPPIARNYLKPTTCSATDVSKQHGKKPFSTHGTGLNKTTSLDRKTPTQTNTGLSTKSPLRSFSSLGKTIASQKPVHDKNMKAPAKDAGKQWSLHGRPVGTVKKGGTYCKKRATGNAASAIKQQITGALAHKKVQSPNASEVKLQDQESSFSEPQEQTMEVVLSNNEKGTDDLVPAGQEPLNVEQTEAENNDKDAKIVTAEFSTVIEHQDEPPVGINIEEPEDKSYIEETSSKQQDLGEHMNEVDDSNNGESVSCNPNGGAKEKLVVEEEEDEETALDQKEEVASTSEAQEFQVTEGEKVAEDKKQELENVAPKQRVHGKKDYAVSNDVIEETAIKLREQRKNKVKALAGAFETVISFQETK